MDRCGVPVTNPVGKQKWTNPKERYPRVSSGHHMLLKHTHRHTCTHKCTCTHMTTHVYPCTHMTAYTHQIHRRNAGTSINSLQRWLIVYYRTVLLSTIRTWPWPMVTPTESIFPWLPWVYMIPWPYLLFMPLTRAEWFPFKQSTLRDSWGSNLVWGLWREETGWRSLISESPCRPQEVAGHAGCLMKKI